MTFTPIIVRKPGKSSGGKLCKYSGGRNVTLDIGPRPAVRKGKSLGDWGGGGGGDHWVNYSPGWGRSGDTNKRRVNTQARDAIPGLSLISALYQYGKQ